MFFVARKLYCPQNTVFKMWVAELKGNRVLALFPFDGERQSMMWSEDLFLSAVDGAKSYVDIKNEPAVEEEKPLFLYSAMIADGDGLCDNTPIVQLSDFSR